MFEIGEEICHFIRYFGLVGRCPKQEGEGGHLKSAFLSATFHEGNHVYIREHSMFVTKQNGVEGL